MADLTLFASTATAIVLEAAPFLLLGSLVGAIIEVFVSDAALVRLIPRNGFGQVALGVFAGLFLPSCECGIVPIARRLLLKGVPPRTAIPYMMTAPVINPVVIASTLFAFQGDLRMTLLRVALVLIPAVGLGLSLGSGSPADVLRRAPVDLPRYQGPDVDHDHGDDCECGCHGERAGSVAALLRHTGAEFLSMLRFLVFGALVAAAFKTFTPPEVLGAFTSSPWLAIVGLMLLAVLLSVCSEADAFVAASFTSFPTLAKAAFLALGPMVDLKLIPMFFSVFKRRIAVALILVPTVSIYLASLFLAQAGL